MPVLKLVHSAPDTKRTPDKSAAMLSVPPAGSAKESPVSPLATPKVSASDHGALEEINRHLGQARRCLALRNFIWAGAHINNASRAAMHIHDHALRAEWEQRLVVFIRQAVESCEKSLKR